MALPSFYLLAEADVPWVIVAFIFIAFIRWIFEQIALRRNPPELVPEDEDEFEEGYERQATPQQNAPETASADLRKFLESLAGIPEEPATPPPPPQERPKPPPVPVDRKVEKPKLTRDEQIALNRLKERQAKQKAREERKKRESHPTALRSMLRNPDSLRTAFVLKEILDKPKALRDDWP